MNGLLIRRVSIGVVAIAMIAVLYLGSRSIDLTRHDEIVATMLDQRQLNDEVSQDVLLIRCEEVRHFDDVVIHDREIDGLAQIPDSLPFTASPQERELLRSSIREYHEIIDERRILIEDFKAEMAILRNSMRYFPALMTSIRDSMPPDSPHLSSHLYELEQSVLAFGLNGGDADRSAATAKLAMIDGDPSMPEIREHADWAHVRTHTRYIVEYHAHVADLLNQILSLPVDESEARIFSEYTTLFETASMRAKMYKSGVYVCCLILGVMTVVMMIRIRRTAQLRATMNERLEAEVAERTRELEERNEELDTARATAITANHSKTAFLANMSHEIRTPMTAILGYAELLIDEPESVDLTDTVKTIQRNGTHLLGLINDVLDISKIEAGRMTVEQIETNVAQIVSEVLSLMRVRATAKGLTLEAEYVYPVPAVITSDPLRLRQILVNLVGNAVKFTDQGGVRLIVRMHEADAETLSIEVADTGIGMTEKQMSSLFEAFAQADVSTTRKFGGTGLGLAISKRLASLLGGDITVSSIENEGSSFTMAIRTGSLADARWVRATEPFIEERREDPEAPTTGPRLEGVRILLAEDGPDNQRLISFHLRKAGATVDIAENGRIALERYQASARGEIDPYDVIVSDMQMPEMDGYTSVGHIRDEGFAGPIIALTAHAMAGDRDRCLMAGCDDYITKPIDRAKLVGAVTTALSRRTASPAE